MPAAVAIANRCGSMTRNLGPAARYRGLFVFGAASCDSLYRFKQPAEAELNSDLKSLFSYPRHGNPTKLQG